jgi:hypothetical protein
MKTLINWTLAVLLIGFTSQAFASPPAQLDLWKQDPWLFGKCGLCSDLIRSSENVDRANFSDYNLYTQTGYYSAVLHGPENSTTTLFGEQNYQTDRGFLIIVKKDDTVVLIENLDEFTPGEWTDVQAEKGWSGAYSVFYQPFPLFKSNVRSIKWGKWWGAEDNI